MQKIASVGFSARRVASSDGVELSVREWGNRDGPEILLIHGGIQSQLAWQKQTRSALADEFRIVTFDLRGHGESGKPDDPARYSDATLWADDVQAVITATGLKRPVLVAWSAGGRVALQYILTHGDGALAGLQLVDASDPRHFAESARQLIPMMAGTSLEDRIAYTDAFIGACFAQPPSIADHHYMVAFNMVVPPVSRAGMTSWKIDIDDALAKITVPVWVTHGALDAIMGVGAAYNYAQRIGKARLSIYASAGHMPFWEEPDRFNAELAAFRRETSGPAG